MAKQKNRLTTTRQVLARERFAYPGPPFTLACTGADIKLNQDKPAYPRPHTSHIIDRPALESILEPTMSKQPTRLDGTPIDGIPPSLTRLPCTARPETTHQKSHNPYKSPEIRRTHWGNRGEGRLTLSRS